MTGLQFPVEPDQNLAKALPFWSTREVRVYGLEGGDTSHLEKVLLHGAVYCVALIVITATLAAIRLRRRPHMRVRSTATRSGRSGC